MINIPEDDVKEMFEAASPYQNENERREALRKQALKFLYDNQECFVAQWILQNPYAEISEYSLKFVYNDESHLGYSVTMEKIDV